MSREQWEIELLELQFPQFTDAIRHYIGEQLSSHKGADITDAIIDDLWAAHSEILGVALDPQGLAHSSPPNEIYAPDVWPDLRGALGAYLSKARQFQSYLASLDDGALRELYRDEFLLLEKSKRALRDQRAREKDQWEFFHKPAVEADFDQWRSKLLSPSEAVALSLAKDPYRVRSDNLKPFRRPGGSPFREKFKDRLDLVETAVRAGELPDPMSVNAFVAWAASHSMPLPPELLPSVESEQKIDIEFWKNRCQKVQEELDALRRSIDELPPKSIASIYRLILGMAIARFEHTTGGRSNAIKTIEGALTDLNLKLGDDTIRELLRDAATHLDYENIKGAAVVRRATSNIVGPEIGLADPTSGTAVC